MKRIIKFSLFIILYCLSSGSSFAQESLNLDFENRNYHKYWLSQGEGFAFSIDSLEQYTRKFSFKIEKPANRNEKVGIFSGILPVEIFANKNVEFRGWIKTKEVKNGYAGLCYRVDGKGGGSLGADFMNGRGLTGDNDWTQVSIRIDISKDAKAIYFGGLLAGEGVAWFDNFELYVNGKKYIDLAESEPKTILSQKEITALKKYIYPLRTYEPDGGDTKDLKVLDKLIGNSTVVALGEASHGTSEIFKMKNRIIQYLAANNGFDIFSIEANMPESYKLNNYTVYGNGDPKELITGMYFWEWDTKEMLNMVEWMHAFNQPTHRMAFTGFDMQFYNGAINNLFDAFKGNKGIEEKITDLKKELDEVVAKKLSNSWNSDNTDSLLLVLQHSVEASLFQPSQKNWLQQNIEIIRQYSGMELWDVNWRDSCMAANFMWIKEHNPKSKCVIWAHNGHIMKTPLNRRAHTNMGYYLVQKLGCDYTTFGLTFFDGRFTADGRKGITDYEAAQALPGTLEYLLNQLNEPIFILDLKKIKADKNKDTRWLLEKLDYRSVGKVKTENAYEFLGGREIVNDFDYLIFIKTSSPSSLLSLADNTKQESYKGTISDGFNLDFENIEKGMPTDWQANKRGNYKFASDSITVKSGKYAVSIELIDGSPQFAILGLIISENYDGEQITLSGYVKTENITDGYASLLMRIDPNIGSKDVQIKGTTDWTKYEVTVKMDPEKTKNFAVAAMLFGKGKAWFDDLKISIDGKDISEIKPIKQFSINHVDNKLK